MRSAMGMGRVALLRQVLAESLLLAVLGGAFGVGLAFGAVKPIQGDCGTCHSTAGWSDGRLGSVLGWGLGAAVSSRGIYRRSFSGAPSVSPGSDGGAEKRGAERDCGKRGSAVAAGSHDATDSADLPALLVGAGLLIRTMVNIAKVPSGYNTGRILTMSVTEVQSWSTWGSFHRQALERVAALPGVQYAAFAWGVPLTGNNWPATLEIEGRPPVLGKSDKRALPLRAVTPDYFKLMGMALIEGREFRSTG